MRSKTVDKIELYNTISHLVGIILGIAFTILLLKKALILNSKPLVIGSIIYGLCFIFLFSASTIYHAVTNKNAKRVLRKFDHAAIFIFIAGTYTPIIISIYTKFLFYLFMTVLWVVGILGLIYEVVFLEKEKYSPKISLALYIIMGWLAIFMMKSIITKTSLGFIIFLFLGGVFYTSGTYFFKKESWLYHHVVWHFFVLFGAISHFIGIYFYLIK